MIENLIIREYNSSDEKKWLQCRLISFHDSAYYDDVYTKKPIFNNSSLELVAELNGEIIPAGLGIDLSNSSVVIVDDDFGPGLFAFKSSETYVDEGGRRAKIIVERKDGANGTVSAFAELENPTRAISVKVIILILFIKFFLLFCFL